MRKLILSWLVVLSCCVGNTVLAAPQTGWWWNPAQSGRGFFVESDNGTTFIGAYLYDDDGHATWLVSGGPNADPYNYTGQLYNKSNGQTLFGNYVAPGAANVVGTLSVHFSDDTHGTLTWPGGTVAIERQIFDTTAAPFQPLSGWWWDPAEDGSGYSVEVQGNNLFVVGFMYDDTGRPVWYFAAGPMIDGQTFHGDVLQFANGQTMGGRYRPPGAPAKIATLDIAFTAQNEATFTFTESSASGTLRKQTKAGRSKTKPMQPQLPKQGTFVFPAAYDVTFDLLSKTSVAPVTASYALGNAGPIRVSKVGIPIAVPGTAGVVQFYAQQIGTNPSFILDYEYRAADCSFVKTVTINGVPFDLTITSYAKYTLRFLVPATVLSGNLKCSESNPPISLPVPPFDVTFSGPVLSRDPDGKSFAGYIWGSLNGSVLGNTSSYRWDLKPTP